jgi:oligopeptide transport system ATP-binding protein
MTAPLLEVRDLAKTFERPRSLADLVLGVAARRLQAVRGVSFELRRGETLGLVGESGCGKSTLGRCIAGFHAPSSGEIRLEGRPLARLGRAALARQVQMIFQDPYASLNPRLTVGRALAEVLRVHGLRDAAAIAPRVLELLDLVGLPVQAADRLPHEFSGGQRQRISIARALAAEPELIIADEPVSALDVSIQAQILNLFEKLQSELGLTLLFIAHDLNVVRHISDRIAVMYLGEIVELSDADTIFDEPRHPYTRALLSAIAVPDPARRTEAVSLAGELPDPTNPPRGCGLVTRCPIAIERCVHEHPALVRHGAAEVRCLRAAEFGNSDPAIQENQLAGPPRPT